MTAPELRPRVLLIDDDTGLLESMKMLLSDDCDVTACSSGADALRAAKARRFDVVLTDYKMPEMTGAEFAAALKREVQPTPYCLMLTGTPSALTPNVPGATDLVMVLSKPYDPARVHRLVLQIGRLGANRRGTPPTSA